MRLLTVNDKLPIPLPNKLEGVTVCQEWPSRFHNSPSPSEETLEDMSKADM